MSLSSKHTYNQHLAILTEFPKEKPSRENLDLPPTHVPPDRHAHTHTHTHTHTSPLGRWSSHEQGQMVAGLFIRQLEKKVTNAHLCPKFVGD